MLLRVAWRAAAWIRRHDLDVFILLLVVSRVHGHSPLADADVHFARWVPSELVLIGSGNFWKLDKYLLKSYCLVTLIIPPGCPVRCKSLIEFCCCNMCPFMGSLNRPNIPSLISMSVGYGLLGSPCCHVRGAQIAFEALILFKKNISFK